MPSDSEPSGHELSAYELKRQENIERNNQRLRDLGLVKNPPPPKQGPKHRKPNKTKVVTGKTRTTRATAAAASKREDSSLGQGTKSHGNNAFDGATSNERTESHGNDTFNGATSNEGSITNINKVKGRDDQQFLQMLYTYQVYSSRGVNNFDAESENPEERNLAIWISDMIRMKRDFDNGKLDDRDEDFLDVIEEQLMLLQSITTFPLQRTRAERQDNNIGLLLKFKEAKGHLRVPQRSNNPEFAKLGKYVNRLREEYNGSRARRQLTDDLIEQLEEMGFEWKVKKSNEEAWNDKYQLLKTWRNENGHCNVTAKEDPVLRKWIGSQRTKKKNGKLSAKQIDLLHKIGFEWEIRKCEAKSDSE